MSALSPTPPCCYSLIVPLISPPPTPPPLPVHDGEKSTGGWLTARLTCKK